MQLERLSREDRFERRRQIAESLRAGKLPDEVSREFKVSLETVRRSAVENGLKVINRPVAVEAESAKPIEGVDSQLNRVK